MGHRPELGSGLAERAPVAVRELKRTFEDDQLDAADTERDRLLAAAFSSDDAAEGITAFLEKRRPRFTGR